MAGATAVDRASGSAAKEHMKGRRRPPLLLYSGASTRGATSITCAPSGGSNLTAQPEASDDDIPNNGGGSYNQDSTFNVTAGSTYVCTLVVDP